MKIIYTILLLVMFLFLSDSFVFAQYKNLEVKFGPYRYSTKFDTSNYLTTLKIKKGKSTISYKTSEYLISGITEYDLDNDGEKEILLDLYSGGAHCCTYLVAARITDDKFTILDTISWGNSYYTMQDLDSNGKHEITGYNDMFAYAFTNFAESEFNVIVYEFQGNKFVNVTKNYPKFVEEDIEDHLNQLTPFMTDTGYACPASIDEDTFNTEAGSVKAILAPIVADYYSIGNVKKGYEIVDSVYKCADKDKFIQTLQNDYKLK
ncbi:MAG: hypothetical protein ABI528_03305 [bacterium]